ncbi:MAG: transcription termination factor Rho [Ilumatobacteraceae bacterium]|nr:transcription termination factor Rho [Ilumatobacteraceae bacterium]
MSDGSGFDMTLLEGKDRAELAAIAEQLGQKPGARAKKADIVSLILRLVGADGSEGDGTAEADDAPQAPDTEVRADGDGEADGDAEAPASEAAESSADTDTEDEPGSGEQNRRGGGRNGGQGQDQGGRNQGNQGRGNQDQGNQDQGGRNQGNQGQSNQGNQQGGDANEPDGNQRDPQSDQQDADGESGNRRRRRRGRDRDRRPEGDDQAPIDPIEVEGMVDLRDEGYGFLRLHGYLASRDDAYISVKQTRQFGLRTGDIVRGRSRPPARNEKNPALLQVDSVNGFEAHNQPARPRFGELTAVFPTERLTLELADDPSNATARAIDLLAPIGKGSRGLVVAPPKAGATTLLKNVVRSIEANHADVEVFVLLVAGRPEEVTDMKRWLLRGSVASSTFDRPPEEHTSVAELVTERAKRLVESGKDVVVVVDGLTRLTRAHNLAAPTGGRVVAGALDTTALFPPKQLFGAARNAEEGGSLTVLATIDTGTGSATDEAIFDEFRGTETLEIRLDGRLAARRIFPAIDVSASSTRQQDLLLDRTQLEQAAVLRDGLSRTEAESETPGGGLVELLGRLEATKTNAALLADAAKSARSAKG